MKCPPKKCTITAEPTIRHDGDAIVIDIPMSLRHRAGRKEIVLPPSVTSERDDACDDPPPSLLAISVARAFRWQEMIETGEADSNTALARKPRLDQSYIARTIRLTSLAPHLVDAVLDGQEPDGLPRRSGAKTGLSLRSLRRDLPLAWEEQRRMLHTY